MRFFKEDFYLASYFYDDFERFDSDLKRLRQKHRCIKVGRKLLSLVDGGSTKLIPKDILQFHNQYYYLFDIIQDVYQGNSEYDSGPWSQKVYIFLRDNFYCYVKDPCSYFRECYEYLRDNKDAIPDMKLLYNKLNALDISTIFMNKEDDYAGVYSYIPSEHEYPSKYMILQNMEILPGFSKDDMSYRCSGSSYKIDAYWKNLYLNSLSIDPRSLPDDLKELDEMFENSRPMYDDIRGTLKSAYQIERLQEVADRLRYLGSLLESKKARGLVEQQSAVDERVIDLAKEEQMARDQWLLDRYPMVSREQLEEQKVLYNQKKKQK